MTEPTTAEIRARHNIWEKKFQSIPDDLRDTEFSQNHIDRGILLDRLEAAEEALEAVQTYLDAVDEDAMQHNYLELYDDMITALAKAEVTE